MAAAAQATTGYVAISRRSLDIEDYIDIGRRHIGWILGPTFAGLVVSIVVAFMLQNTYISEAEMQITPAQISESIVPSTLNQQLTERIMQMENEILSRTSLSSIIQDPRLDLYKEDRAKVPIEDVIDNMRNKGISIQIVSLPGTMGRRASAFKVSFSYTDRYKAQAVVQTLITKFQDANLTSQRTQQNVLGDFVTDELNQAKANLDRLTEELTKFRVENQGKLPEQSQMNMSTLGSLQGQAGGINDALNRLDQQRVQLETHLATLNSQKDLAGLLENDMDTPTSPVAQKNERLMLLNRSITDGETQLNQLLKTYKETYPDIRELKGRLDVLRQERDSILEQQLEEESKPKAAPKKAVNYQMAQSMNQLQGQIDQTQAALRNLAQERAFRVKEQEEILKEVTAYRDRLSATSSIEAQYADMMRDQQAAQMKYQELKGKQQITEQNKELIQRKAGETLDVLDPPSLPVKPAKPNRTMIVGAGVAIAFVVGLALAGLQEAKDTSLKNLKDVRAYTNLPVLSSIPLLENTLLVKRKRRVVYLAWSAAVIVGVIAVCGALFYYYTVTVKG